MKALEFETHIDAPRELVWRTMLEPDTYESWTEAFSPGSRFEGSWEEDAEIYFVDQSGQGMYAKIAANREHEYVEIDHLGLVDGGVVDTTSPAAAQWTPAKETYEFTDDGDGTLLKVTMEVDEQNAEMFAGMWPGALEGLKELAEAKAADAA